MIVFDGGYVGLAPVPGGRVNVGIVLADRRWRERLAAEGAEAGVASAVWAIPAAVDDPVLGLGQRCDAIEGRPDRVAGQPAAPARAGSSSATPPASSTRSPARASIGRSSPPSLRAAAVRRARRRPTALAAYDRAMRRAVRRQGRRQPPRPGVPRRPALFDYAARRLAAREPSVRRWAS